MRVLIINTFSLEEIIHALPVLDYLKQISDKTDIDWVVEESFQELLTGNPLVTKLHIVRTRDWQRRYFSPTSWREISQLKSALRECVYDIVFDLQGDIASGFIAWLTASPRRYGFDQSLVRQPVNAKFINNRIPLRRQDNHCNDRLLRMVSVPFGKDYRAYSLKTDICTAAEDAAAELFLATLSDGLVIILHPGASWKTKMWYETGWIALGGELLDRFADATLLLSAENHEERNIAERIAAGIGRQTRLLPQLSLKGFAALVKKTDLLVGTDSWPVQLAAAVGTPTVSCYRSTDGKRNGPRGELHRVVQSPFACARCLTVDCKRDQECRESVTVASMIAACSELLHGGPEI
jgi:heptosyltransferase-1